MTSVDFGQWRSPFSARNRDAYALEGIERIAVAAHHVIAHAGAGTLGHLKLNRILWYADLEHFRKCGNAITGLQHYSRTPHGPVSWMISRAVGALVRQGGVAERSIELADYTRRALVSLEEPDSCLLSEQQIEILRRMADIVAPLSATEMIAWARADPLWQETEPDGPMLVSTGSIITRPPAPNT